ncbi:MAG: sugar ABC transporter substrate-binding protein, partial [Gemmatimonadetes bacterium]|nr:sugar ABC transporter substrate-binding protein [Gemmatimonadota bacterium]
MAARDTWTRIPAAFLVAGLIACGGGGGGGDTEAGMEEEAAP